MGGVDKTVVSCYSYFILCGNWQYGYNPVNRIKYLLHAQKPNVEDEIKYTHQILCRGEGVNLCRGEGVNLCRGEGVNLFRGEGVNLCRGEGVNRAGYQRH